MLLFEPKIVNVLPMDGTADYHGRLMDEAVATQHFDGLLNGIDWRHDEAKIFGKHYVTKRKVAWYGDQEFEYTYSGITKRALLWTDHLLELRSIVQEATHHTYNSCLLNLYHDGSEGMAYHSDGEKMLKEDAPIASLSFGAQRRFSFKHKETKETVSLELEHGSLLVMREGCQQNWLHRLPPTKKVKSPRINLTFRTILIS